MNTAQVAGYASLFDVADLGGDSVARGAFAACLRRRPPQEIKMLYQHDMHLPVGIWTELVEDGRGLFVRGEVNLDVQLGAESLALIEQGALTGLSIGFNPVRSVKLEKGRLLTEIDLWEVSLVTFPMLPSARVSAVKAGSEDAVLQTLTTLTDLMRV